MLDRQGDAVPRQTGDVRRLGWKNLPEAVIDAVRPHGYVERAVLVTTLGRAGTELRLLLAGLMIELSLMIGNGVVAILPRLHPARIFLTGRTDQVREPLTGSMRGTSPVHRAGAYLIISSAFLLLVVVIDWLDPFGL